LKFLMIYRMILTTMSWQIIYSPNKGVKYLSALLTNQVWIDFHRSSFHRCTVHIASINSIIFQLMHTIYKLLKSTKIHIKKHLKTCPYMFRSHF
jgi:hypothetical protein